MRVFRMQNALDRHEDEISALRRQNSDFDTALRKLDLEFTELYDKVRHQMSRMAKRDAAASKANGEQLGEIPSKSDSPFLDPISRAIHERRGTSFLAPGENE